MLAILIYKLQHPRLSLGRYVCVGGSLSPRKLRNIFLTSPLCVGARRIESWKSLLWSSRFLRTFVAFAVGELGFREVGPRTRVYAESADVEVLDAAEVEFAGAEEMIRQGEKLFGEYDWERFDLLVLPPSFPYGGFMDFDCSLLLLPLATNRNKSD